MLKQNMYTIEEGEPSVFERETKKSALALQAAKQKLLYGQPRAGRDDDHQACALDFAMHRAAACSIAPPPCILLISNSLSKHDFQPGEGKTVSLP